MNSQRVSTRDTVSGIPYLASIVTGIIALAPFHLTVLLAAVGLGIVAYLTALHKLVALGAEFWVLGARFLFVFFLGKGWLTLVGGAFCAAIGYAIYKLDPESQRYVG